MILENKTLKLLESDDNFIVSMVLSCINFQK